MKLCRGCGTEKSEDCFTRDKTKQDGLRTQCKDCHRVKRQQSYAENRVEIRRDRKASYDANKTAINTERRAAYAAKDKIEINVKRKADYAANKVEINERRRADPDGQKKARRKQEYDNNRDQILADVKKRRAANPEPTRARSRAWSKANPERVLENNRAWRKANPEKLAARRKRERARRKMNPNQRLADSLRQRLGVAIRNQQKSGSAVFDLGCTIDELKTYLESKFEPNMSWDNWSKIGWHIDHIKALSKFDLTDREQFLKAVHYTNLQPLWWLDNLKKGNRG